MNSATFHSATLALIRKRDGEVLLTKATRKNPTNGLQVGFWALPRSENSLNERSDQAAFRIAQAYGFGIVESVQELAHCEVEEKVRNISKRNTLTLALCEVDERSCKRLGDYVWSSMFIATKLLEESRMPDVFLQKLLELGLYTNHDKPVFEFSESPAALPQKPKKQIASNGVS